MQLSPIGLISSSFAALLILLARSGYRVKGFEYIQVDAEGRVVPRVPGPKRSEYGLNRGLRLTIEPENGGVEASLYYISLEGLIKAIGIPREDLCTGCLTGVYPVEIPGEQCEARQTKLQNFTGE